MSDFKFYQSFGITNAKDAKKVEDFLKKEQIIYAVDCCPLALFEYNEATYYLTQLYNVNTSNNTPIFVTDTLIDEVATDLGNVEYVDSEVIKKSICRTLARHDLHLYNAHMNG